MNKITVFLVVLTCLAHAIHRNRKEDKLLLSPIELIDLVRQEQHKNKAPQQTATVVAHTEKTSKPLEPDNSEYDIAPPCVNVLFFRKINSFDVQPPQSVHYTRLLKTYFHTTLLQAAKIQGGKVEIQKEHIEIYKINPFPKLPENFPVSCEDDQTLKNRKIWSRWSKWGDCSVTCGDGIVIRYRVCVAGRCAPGEREEQRRPCARAPCHAAFYNITDDPPEADN